MKDSTVCLIGVGLLVLGAPILAGGILMLVLGQSGGSIGFDVCCNQVDISGSHTFCSSYVSRASCPGFPVSSPAPTAEEATLTFTDVRSDTAYSFFVDIPTGVSINSDITIAEPQQSPLYSATVSSSAPSNLVCDGASDGNPPMKRVALRSGVELDDGDALSVRTVFSATDSEGSMVCSALGKPYFPPKLVVEPDGLNSQQEWGIVLIVIGGTLVAPPVCVLGVLLGGN